MSIFFCCWACGLKVVCKSKVARELKFFRFPTKRKRKRSMLLRKSTINQKKIVVYSLITIKFNRKIINNLKLNIKLKHMQKLINI